MRLIRRSGAVISALFIGLLVGSTLTAQAADIIGTRDNDTILGTADPDDIMGLGGHDRIEGFGDGDVIVAGTGNDTLIGDAGRDILHGRRGFDTLYADVESTLMTDNPEADHVWGGPNDDTIYAQDGFEDHIDCGEGTNDTAFVDVEDITIGCENVVLPPQ